MALKGIHFDNIYSSDLERAFDTACSIATKNLDASKTATGDKHSMVESNKLLRERSFGIFDLKAKAEFEAAAKKAGFGDGENLYSYKPQGGEDKMDIKERAIQFLKFLTKTITENAALYQNVENKTPNILLVSHSGLLTQMARYLVQDCKCDLSDLNEDVRENVLKGQCSLKNTAISNFELLIDSNSGDVISVRCLKYGCVQHLKAIRAIGS